VRLLEKGLGGLARWAEERAPDEEGCEFLDFRSAAADGVLYVVGGRADAIEIAAERALRATPVRALDARGFWHWVLQVGGDRHEGRVALAGVEPDSVVTVELPRPFPPALPSRQLRVAADALAAIEAAFPPREFAAVAATALRNVLWLLPGARQWSPARVDSRDLDRVLAHELLWAVAARDREKGGYCPLHRRDSCEPCRFV
jgi:hypothetical protein